MLKHEVFPWEPLSLLSHEDPRSANMIRFSPVTHYFVLACGTFTPQPTSEQGFFLTPVDGIKVLEQQSNRELTATASAPSQP